MCPLELRFSQSICPVVGLLKQPKCPSADEWIKKIWYVYTMEYYSAIKRRCGDVGSSVEMWKDLESAIHRSKSEKNKYHVLACIVESREMIQKTYFQGRNTAAEVKKRRVDPVGEGEGGTNWEIRTDTYILPCVRS